MTSVCALILVLTITLPLLTALPTKTKTAYKRLVADGLLSAETALPTKTKTAYKRRLTDGLLSAETVPFLRAVRAFADPPTFIAKDELGLLRMRKTVSGTEEERCDAYEEAIERIRDAFAAANDVDWVRRFAAAFATKSGLDLNDPEAIRTSACQTAAVTSLEDLADQAGVTVEEMRPAYNTLVLTLRATKLIYLHLANPEYYTITEPEREVLLASAGYLQTMEDYGYFDF